MAVTDKMGENKNRKIGKQSYFSWKGLGLLDLIPGVRDLPYPVRLVLMVFTVVVLVSILFGLKVLTEI